MGKAPGSNLSMFPFLKNRQAGSIAGSIIMKRKDEHELEANPALKLLAEELIDCVHAKGADGAAKAMHLMFQLMELMPHAEEEDDASTQG